MLIAALALASAGPLFASDADDCVAAKLDPSLAIISQLNEQHLDLSRPKEVSQLFIGTNKNLKSLIEPLKQLGYEAGEPKRKQLLAVANVAVREGWVQSIIPKMCAAAEAASVEYDGWEIDVAADNIQSDSAK
jgi:hypothetical protein